jgi:FdhD protein
MTSSALREVRVRRAQPDAALGPETDDAVAVEEPLEIVVDEDTIAITMRTPGSDRELVMGFLFAEGVITQRDDVTGLAPCDRTRGRAEAADARGNTMRVTLAPGVRAVLEEGGLHRRGTVVTSACGVCGRRAVDDLLARAAPLPAPTPEADYMRCRTLRGAMEGLRGRQPLFARTAGCHAASLVTWRGEPVATFEDVGRHNAVDKLIGHLLLTGGPVPAAGHALLVSGRASFEIVQKAIVAGVPIVASVSAASSLAVELAVRANVTLAGFVRPSGLTVYATPERLSAGGA